jgi:CBS domain-containing protein
VERQTTIGQLGTLFEQHDFNAFPVMEDGQVLGLVTKFDFLRTFAFTSSQMVPLYDDLMSRRVADVMTEAIVHVDPTLPLTRVLQLMASLKMRGKSAMLFDVCNVSLKPRDRGSEPGSQSGGLNRRSSWTQRRTSRCLPRYWIYRYPSNLLWNYYRKNCGGDRWRR